MNIYVYTRNYKVFIFTHIRRHYHLMIFKLNYSYVCIYFLRTDRDDALHKSIWWFRWILFLFCMQTTDGISWRGGEGKEYCAYLNSVRQMNETCAGFRCLWTVRCLSYANEIKMHYGGSSSNRKSAHECINKWTKEKASDTHRDRKCI